MPVLNLSQFLEKLKVNNYTFYLDGNTQTSSEMGSGALKRTAMGSRLWKGSVALSAMSYDDSRTIESLMEEIQEGDVYFLIQPLKAEKPKSWVSGDGLSGASTTIGSLSGKSATISGLPASYILSRGDCFTYVYAGTSRLHRLTSDVTASAGGGASVSFLPALPSGLTTGTSVTFSTPRVTAQVVPGSVKVATVGLDRVDGIAFDWVQATKI